MPDTEHPTSADRLEATGARGPSAGPPSVSENSPTVRSGGNGAKAQGSSAGSGRPASGSSLNNKGRPAPLARLPMPVPGDLLESFELVEAVGAGGMGAVFLAADTRLQRQVALKVLPPEQSSDVETVQRFYQEGRAAARLDHENIARVYTIGADRGHHFIAFEFIEGTTVRRKVEQSGPLSVVETINYTLQIANALVHACERGVVHRDIKPSNIIVTPQGRAKLVDMGLARRFERGASDDGLTQSGMTLGTFDYISPEQARDPRDVDVRSDLYSLGCTMFHMLSGRPPFPDGTVLQKLLQHQEEPAPDVRTANPGVPADLSAILLKLMAKDPDRRYQTPEQLVRDLLLVAGAQGLRSLSPEGLVWLENKRPASWERHVFWVIPAAGLAAVVLALLWWGQVGEPPRGFDLAEDPPRMSGPEAPPALLAPRVTTTASASAPAVSVPGPIREPAGPLVVRSIPVASTEDLAQVLSKAPSGSTLTLTDDGPYLLRPEPTGRAGSDIGPPGRDLAIRAAEGIRPLLRMRLDQGLEPVGSELALLRFRGGDIFLEGLEFELDASMLDDPLAAVWAEDASLSVALCRFRRAGTRPDLEPPRAISTTTTGRFLAKGADGSGASVEPVRVLGSHFDGGQVGLRARGPADLVVRDCTFGPAGPAVWLDNSEASGLVPAAVSLERVRVVAGPSPVFRFQKTAAHVALDNSVVASGDSGLGTLVATDEPEALDWFGRGNLYGRIGVFLQPTDGRIGHESEAVESFSAWADDPATIRETRSASTREPVWSLDEADQAEALASREPSSAFSVELFDSGFGADGLAEGGNREIGRAGRDGGPAGRASSDLRPAGQLLAKLLDSPLMRRASEPEPDPEPASEPVQEALGSSDPGRIELLSGLEPVPAEAPPPPFRTSSDETGPLSVRELASGGSMTERIPVYSPPPDTEPVVSAPRHSGPDEPMPMAPMPLDDIEEDMDPLPSTSSGPSGMPDAEPGLVAEASEEAEEPGDLAIRTRSEFEAEMRRLGSRGGTLRLAPDADLSLSTVEVPKAARLTVQAAPGRSRPVLRFEPGMDLPRSSPEVSALFRVAPGAALELSGVDVVVEAPGFSNGRRLAAFTISSGTDLTLTDCSVTLSPRAGGRDGPLTGACLVAVEPDPSGAGGMDGPAAASVRISQGLLRSAGDLVDVGAGARLDDLSLSNVVAASGGSLVHGHGLPRGQSAQPVKLVLRQVTARVEGGLVRLESEPGEPELPVAKVVARDTVLATTPEGDPLVRIEGQDGLDTLRDRVPWEGHSVFYHQIDTYRRDQTALSGTSPVGFKRSSWEVAVGPSEDAPGHGDAQFERPWPSDRPLWTIQPSDVALDSDSPAWGSGADVDRIPSGPTSGSR